jgi:hypothetical protein
MPYEMFPTRRFDANTYWPASRAIGDMTHLTLPEDLQLSHVERVKLIEFPSTDAAQIATNNGTSTITNLNVMPSAITELSDTSTVGMTIDGLGYAGDVIDLGKM